MAWPAWVAITLFYLAVRVPLLDVPLDRDEGAFGVVGQAILRGELPYRDIFDHKPPGVFYIYALALTVVGPTARGIHGFLLLWNLATLLVVASFARRAWGARAGRWAGWWYAFASAVPTVQGFMAGTEMLLLLPLVASLRLVLAAGASRGWARHAALLGSGACGAAACWVKQPAALTLLAVPVLVAALPTGVSGRGGVLRAMAWWLAGGLALSVAVVTPFVWAGAASELYYWSFSYNYLYRGSADAGGWSGRWGALSEVATDLGPLFLLAAVGGVWWWRTQCKKDAAADGLGLPAWPVWVLLLGSLAGAGLAEYAYPHYFAQVLPALVLLAGLAFAGVERRAVGRWPTLARVGLATAVLLPLTVAAALRPWYWWRPDPQMVSIRMLGRQAFEAGPIVARYLAERTEPDDWLFIFGSEAQIAFQAERRNANPFVTAYAFTGPWPRSRELQERVWATVERVRPTYFVMPYTPHTLLWHPGTDRFLADRLAELGRREYCLEACVASIPGEGLQLVEPPSDRQRHERRAEIPIELWRRCRGGP